MFGVLRRAWWPDDASDALLSERLLSVFHEQGPFEGLLGFSEGARAAQFATRLEAFKGLRFLVLCGAPCLEGFESHLRSLHFASSKEEGRVCHQGSEMVRFEVQEHIWSYLSCNGAA